MANLMKYEDGSYIRTATANETAASLAAAERDGGVGAITVEIDGDPTTCYVIGEMEFGFVANNRNGVAVAEPVKKQDGRWIFTEYGGTAKGTVYDSQEKAKAAARRKWICK